MTLAACGGGDGSPGASPSASPTGSASSLEARAVEATGGLCEARDLAAAGDVEGARAAFFDRSHDTIHEVADAALVAGHPEESGALLEAKRPVEAQGSPNAPRLRRDIAELIDVFRDALAVLGIEAPPC
jgi:hypothetical protein